MKIEFVTIHNWEAPGNEWWMKVEAVPDQPVIEATVKMTLSYREYRSLLDQDEKYKAA